MSQVDVMSVDDIPPGSMVRVEVEGHPICLANVDGTLHAVHDTCTHGMASLSAGWLDPDMVRVECPRHGAYFRLSDGAAITPPATASLPVYPVEVRDGRVLIQPVPSSPHPFDTP
jgi:3-phenylpropionate/trans-cinnamate dioxygenase ferredoxin component